jgi:hypothetical protein
MLNRPTYRVLVLCVVLLASCIEDPYEQGSYTDFAKCPKCPQELLADGSSTYPIEFQLELALKESLNIVVETDFGTLSKSVVFGSEASGSLTFQSGAPNLRFFLRTSSSFRDTARLNAAIGDRTVTLCSVKVSKVAPDDFHFHTVNSKMGTSDTLQMEIRTFRNMGTVTDGVSVSIARDTLSGSPVVHVDPVAYVKDGIIKFPVVTHMSETGTVELKASMELNSGMTVSKSFFITIE